MDRMQVSLSIDDSDTEDMRNTGRLLDEYTECASPMPSAYCHLMSEEEYSKTGATETEKALRELISHLESNPDQYLKLMRKRKVEEMENQGLMSYIKCKVRSKLMGDVRYEASLVTERECQQSLEELTDGMMVVHHYAQEAKRCSQRLANKQNSENNIADVPGLKNSALGLKVCGRRLKEKNGSCVDGTDQSHEVLNLKRSFGTDQSCDILDLKRPSLRSVENVTSGTSQAAPPPPPPPPPPPVPVLKGGAMLKKGGSKKKKSVCLASSTPVAVKEKSTMKKAGSVTSLADLQHELQSDEPLRRLRSTNVARSPGGTPLLNPSKDPGVPGADGSIDWTSPLNTSEPLGRAFMRILQRKFRDIRSPSPSPSTSFNNSAAFSP